MKLTFIQIQYKNNSSVIFHSGYGFLSAEGNKRNIKLFNTRSKQPYDLNVECRFLIDFLTNI